MNTPKDLEIKQLKDRLDRLERLMQQCVLKITTLERENRRLKGAITRTADNVGAVERKLPRSGR